MSERTSENRYHRYLLGELPESERDALEDEYFATEEGFQELQVAEDELVDAYVAGELSAAQRARFEERFLRTDDGRERVRYARLLQEAAARARPGWAPVPLPAPSSRRPLAWAAGLAAAGLAAVLLVQLAQLRDELRAARSHGEALMRSASAQQEQLRAQQRRLGAMQQELDRLRVQAGRLAGSVRDGARIVSLALRSRLKREMQALPQLTLPPEATAARISLSLDATAAPARRVSIQTPAGREVWARGGLRPVPSDGGLAMVVDVPAARFAPGHHVVVVSSQDGAPLAEYVFQVVRP